MLLVVFLPIYFFLILNSPSLTQALNTINITKSTVGLGNVDNTSDLNKPISTATQNALNAKAPLNNPSFTGTVSGVAKSAVGYNQLKRDIPKGIM